MPIIDKIIFKYHSLDQMKKSYGVIRNKIESLTQAKNQSHRKRNIFKYIGKDQQLSEGDHNNSNHLLSATTKNSVNSSENNDNPATLQIYEQAKGYLALVQQYKKKMVAEIKLRMASFKESQIRIYDQNISRYSNKAVDNLLKSEKILAGMKRMKGSNQVEQKFYRNMQKSLALQIRQVSKSLRAQQKDYYDRLKAYQNGTVNLAIQLRQQDKDKMRDQFEDVQIFQTQMGQNMERNKQVAELVKSINQLNSIYKQLNQLVIEQGSLIDRIDYNIEETFQHIEKGVGHLQKANENAESPCARKCMFILIIGILAMAIVIGFKLSKSTP